MGLLSPKCPSCAASIDFPSHASETRCGYCGNQVLRKQTMLPSIRRREPVRPVHSSSPPPLVVRSNHSPLLWVFVALPLLGAIPAVLMMVRAANPEPSVSMGNRPTLVVADDLSSPAREEEPETPIEAPPVVEEESKNAQRTERRRRRGKRHKAEADVKMPAEFATQPGDAPALSKAAARRVFRSVHMLHCGGAGDLSVNVTIAASGKVTKVSSKEQDEVASCVADTVKGLRFPASVAGLTTSHRYHW